MAKKKIRCFEIEPFIIGSIFGIPFHLPKIHIAILQYCKNTIYLNYIVFKYKRQVSTFFLESEIIFTIGGIHGKNTSNM